MAPKKDTPSPESAEVKSFTPKEAEFIRSLFCNMKTRPDADWDSVATEMSLKDATVAQARYRCICARHGIQFRGASSKDDTADMTGASSSPSKPVKTLQRKPTREALGSPKIKKSPGKRGPKGKIFKTEEQQTTALAMATQDNLEDEGEKPELPYIKIEKGIKCPDSMEAASEAETDILPDEEDLATFSSPEPRKISPQPKYHAYDE